MMSGDPAYRAIEWVDPDLHVRWVASARGSEKDPGTDIAGDADARQALQAAQNTSSTIVSRPVTLRQDTRQGARGVLVCVPIYSQKQLAGFLVGVFRYQDLISSILQGVAEGYWINIYDGCEEIYSGRAISLAG